MTQQSAKVALHEYRALFRAWAKANLTPTVRIEQRIKTPNWHVSSRKEPSSQAPRADLPVSRSRPSTGARV